MNETKIMLCIGNIERTADTGKHPCGVCRTGVGSNSILCRVCSKYIHHRCSDISGKLKYDVNYVCPSCAAPHKTQNVTDTKEMHLADGTRLEIVDRFGYLGDMFVVRCFECPSPLWL